MADYSVTSIGNGELNVNIKINVADEQYLQYCFEDFDLCFTNVNIHSPNNPNVCWNTTYSIQDWVSDYTIDYFCPNQNQQNFYTNVTDIVADDETLDHSFFNNGPTPVMTNQDFNDASFAGYSKVDELMCLHELPEPSNGATYPNDLHLSFVNGSAEVAFPDGSSDHHIGISSLSIGRQYNY